MQVPKYNRILLKISGEALIGDCNYGIDTKIMDNIADQIKEVVEMGLEIAVVIGGGNFWRGVSASANGMDRTTADYIGMLATVMNAVGSAGFFGKKGYFNKSAIFNYNAANRRTFYKKKSS